MYNNVGPIDNFDCIEVCENGSWDDVIDELIFCLRVGLANRLSWRLDPERPSLEEESPSPAWRRWPDERVAGLAVEVIGELVPARCWTVSEDRAVEAVLHTLFRFRGWRDHDESELVCEIVGEIVDFPVRRGECMN